MKKALITLVAASSLLTACHHNDEPTPQEPPEQVVFMYMPWAGSNIYPYFLRNIAGMRQAITDMQGGGKKQVLVLIADNGSRAHLIHLKYEYQKKEKKYNCVNDTIETLQYLNGQSFYSAEGMANMFNKAKAAMPANRYSLIVGCHSMGWLPIDARTDYAKPMFAPSFSKYHNDNEGTPIDREILTRYIGDGVHEDYMAEIPTVATAIRNSFGHMDYILFDDCYMMNIEVAYDLKDVTNYLIASTCEVMIEGMPYNKIGRYLLTGDYEQVVNEFYTHYSAYRNPYGTLAVTKTSEVEQLASVMRQINATHEWVPDSIRTSLSSSSVAPYHTLNAHSVFFLLVTNGPTTSRSSQASPSATRRSATLPVRKKRPLGGRPPTRIEPITHIHKTKETRSVQHRARFM